MGNTLDISSLKSSNTQGTNIDGEELRDFGNGLKEFDPSANGFEPEPEPEKKSDIDRALDMCDDVIERKQEEVVKFNDLLDQYGGEITEEELRDEMGQSFITKALEDGTGGKFEDNPGKSVSVSNVPSDENENNNENVNIQPAQSKELDELEQELDDEEFDTPMDNTTPQYHTVHNKQELNVVEDKAPEPKTEQPKNDTPPQTPKHTVTATNTINNMNTNDELSEEDKDLAALEDEDKAPVDDFEKKLKTELAKKMRPVSRKYDLSNAVVSNKPVTVTNMLSGAVPLNKKIFTWALMRSKRPITMKSFSATELNILSTASRNNARNADIFKTIWEHIVGKAKGSDFHTWCKCTSYYDIDHIWFSIYGACFQESNYLPFNCTECNELTVTNDIPIYEMCKFAKPEYREELERIKQLPEEPYMGEVFAEYRSQITDNIVIGFKEPSIYDSIIAPTLLDSEFTQKYNDVLGIAAYICNIYQVGEINGQVVLKPISLKVFDGNEVKTLKARIIQFAKVIRSLSSDQYNIILNYINNMTEEDNITYGLPETTCDHCHKVLPEERNAASDLVFMRHRLAILGG